jgi:hypothetical protein
MIFKKSAMQGNFIFSNGQPATFVDNYYETEDEAEIAQLDRIYEKVSAKAPVEKAEVSASKVAVAKTGMASSASVAAVTKAQ